MLSKLRETGRDGGCKLTGGDVFGLTAARVREAVESLPGAERCANYTFQADPAAAARRLEAQRAGLAAGRARRAAGGARARDSPHSEGAVRRAAGKGRGKGRGKPVGRLKVAEEGGGGEERVM